MPKPGMQSLRRLLVLPLLAVLAACATEQVGPAPRIVADNADFMIVRAETGDSLASLTRDFLGNDTHTPLAQQANGGPPLAGQLVVLPKRPYNPAAVDAGGYQVVPILCYHQFAKRRATNRMQVTAANFEAQMQYLKDNGFRVISMSDLQGFLAGRQGIPEKAVVLTIDDGYRSVYDIAYPILQRMGLTATLYVYSDFAGISLSWDQIREMQASGVIDIQSHSRSHTSMSPNGYEKLGPPYRDRVEQEIAVPHRILTDKLGTDIIHFAYPYGDTSEDAVKLLEQYGYVTATTVQRGGNAGFMHPLLLRRDMVFSDHSLKDFKKFLTVYKPVDLK